MRPRPLAPRLPGASTGRPSPRRPAPAAPRPRWPAGSAARGTAGWGPRARGAREGPRCPAMAAAHLLACLQLYVRLNIIRVIEQCLTQSYIACKDAVYRVRGPSPAGGRCQMAPIIEARGLTKRFGKTQALDSLDLTAESGQVVALLGPNG